MDLCPVTDPDHSEWLFLVGVGHLARSAHAHIQTGINIVFIFHVSEHEVTADERT